MSLKIKLDDRTINQINESVKRNSMNPKLDNAGLYFARQLEAIDPGNFMEIERDLYAAEDIPFTLGKISSLQKFYTWRKQNRTGMAKLIRDHSDDIPTVNLFAEEFLAESRTYGDSFIYSVDEIETAASQGINLDTEGVDACYRSHAEKWNDVAYFGDSKVGTTGLLNDPNIAVNAAPNNAAASSTAWVDKTFTERKLDLKSAINRVKNNSKLKIKPDTVLMATEPYQAIAGDTVNDANGSNISQLQMLEKMFGVSIVERTELDDYFVSGTKSGMIVFKKDRRYCEFLPAMSPTPMTPQLNNLTWKIIVRSKCVGTLVRFPLAFDITTGI